MKLLLRIFPFFLLLAFSWQACNKDYDGPTDKTAQVRFMGFVKDENGQPIEGATVAVGEVVRQTDRNGVFLLPFIPLPAEHARIQVSKQGFFDFNRVYIIRDRSTKKLDIQLRIKSVTGSISSFIGGKVNLPSGGSVDLPTGVYRYENGSPYQGLVQVAARWIDPTDPNLFAYMPGDLRGINTAGESRILTSYGMMGVELVSAEGDKIQLPEGKKAALRLPIPATLLASAPAEIPLWHFDDKTAMWVEEGAAQRQGDAYVGEVSHFSFWNCDIPFLSATVSGQVRFQSNGTPAGEVWLKMTVLSGSVFSTGVFTTGSPDADGRFDGYVPANTLLQLDILDHCNQVLLSFQLGPFAPGSQNDLSVLSIPPGQFNPFAQLFGNLVDCNGQAITEGYVLVVLGNNNAAIIPVDATGHFDTELFNCDQSPVQLTGVSTGSGQISQPYTYPFVNGNINAGTLIACENFVEGMSLDLDGTTYQFGSLGAYSLFGNLRMVTENNSGNYVGITVSNNQSTGTFPVLYFQTSEFEVDSLPAPIPTLQANITRFGAIGTPVEGTISGTVKDVQGNTHTVNGQYKAVLQ